MTLTIDPRSAVPPFEQIRSQVTAMVDQGTLTAGVRLPTVRTLAHDLGLAANTVARAYRELEQAGVVVTRGRHGTFIAAQPNDPRHRQARQAAAIYAATIRELGLNPAEGLRLVQAALAET